MKKKFYKRIFQGFGRFENLYLMTRLSFILMLISTITVNGNSYSRSEKVSSQLSNETVKDVIKQIGMNDLSLNEVSVQQQRALTGVVKTADGSGLPGATVYEKGTTNGTITDFDGNFTLNVSQPSAVIVFSFIGMTTIEMNYSGQATMDVVLEEETIGLEEVVAVGYGVQRKSDLTGASSRLTEENMNKSIALSPVEMMQGRVSGVNIIQNSGEPGTGMTVRVRGSHSIRSGQEPLYVVDGIPLDNADVTPNGGTSAGINESSNLNPLSFLNTEDIESIDILKDASSTAIYGARGANGVVIITTKKGNKGVATLSYDGYVGVANIREKLDMLSAAEFRSYTKADGTKLEDRGNNTDWQDEIFATGITQSHNLSYGGGTEDFTYQTSLGYLDQEGIIESTGIQKLNGKIKVTQKAFEGRLNLEGSLIASHIEDDRAAIGETGGFEGDLILAALKLNPTFPIFNDNGTYYQAAIDRRNPVAMINLFDDKTQTDRLLSNLSAELEIIPNLRYRLNVGFDRTVAERRVNQDQELTYLSNKGEADINGITASNRLIENYVTYLKDMGEVHSFNFLLGHAYQYFKVSTSELNVNGFTVKDVKYTDELQYGNFSTALANSSAVERELQSFFGRVNYSYLDKYLLTLTGRLDGSSKFGENNKYGFFPSAAVAWRISEESFMEGNTLFSNLKLRLGWGLTGNQEIPEKISQLAVGTQTNANGYFNAALLPGITYLRTPNPDLKWETTMQTNIGLDFGILENRISGTIDYFNKITEDVLLEIPSKQPSPTNTQWLNVPDLEIINNGLELGLNGQLIDQTDLSLELGANFTFINNEVKKLPVTLIQTGVASGQGLSDTRVQIITNGQPVGTFYGMVFEGLDANGVSTYKKDANGVDVKEYLGSALPDFTYSFNAVLKFKNLDFSMFWYGSGGNKVYNNTANTLFFKGPLNNGYNVTREVLESNESPGNSNAFSSRFVEDASFLRFANATLGYRFTNTSLKWIKGARVYVTGNNLLVITDYTGFDPEVSVDANVNNVPSLGIDYTTFPKARTFTFGVNLQF